MPAPVFLRCLGVPELRGPNGEPIRFRTRKHLALLVFLAVEPRVRHRRERLADLFWPDASPAEGRHSLATALSVIRARVGIRTFETSRDTVRLLAPDLSVDLERLARGEVLGDDTTPPLEVGGFLDEFEISKSPEFMLWRDLQRARWFPSIRQAFIVLMDRCRRTGDFTRIEPLADRLLVLDDLSEDAVRAKMEGRAFAGDRLSSIRIFQAWRQRLAEELGATPSPLVEGMALRLRQRGYEPPGTSHIPTVHTEQWRDRAFVGRGPQYRVAYEAWESTNRSAGRHVLLLGDSGIGKTTLAERLVTAAGLEGAVSSRVQCYEVEREIPYAALGTVVRGLLDQPGASATSPEWLAELARCIPAVGHRYPHLPPARESEGETARLRLTEGVHQLLTAVAEEHPVIVVVDDVHLADDASVAVFHLLMRRTQEQRIMIVLSARQAELARSPHASRLMDSRVPLGLTPIELPLLTDDEMNEVVSALARAVDTTAPPAVRRALVRAAAGIPMVVELLFDDWRNHGDQCLALSVGAMTTETLGNVSTEVYEQLLDRVFRGLSNEAKGVLNLAAILGERMNDLGMYQLVDLSLGRTLTGMAELTQQRILRDGGTDLEFRNEMLRGYAYLNVPSPLRRALHGLIADRLIAAETGGESIPGLMLAWHCFRACRVDEAVPYLLRGAREALDRAGSHEVELALTSARTSLAGDDRTQSELLLIEALQEQSRFSESLELMHRLPDGAVKRFPRLAGLEAVAASSAVSSEVSAREWLSRAHQLLSQSEDFRLQADGLAAAYSLVNYLRDPTEAERLLRSTEQFGATWHSGYSAVAARSAAALCTWIVGDERSLVVLLSDLNELAQSSAKKGLINSHVFRALNCAACIDISVGDYAAGLAASEQAFAVAERIANEPQSAAAASNAALCALRIGRYIDAIRWSEKAIEVVQPAGHGWRLINSLRYYSVALCMIGQDSKGIEVAERLIARTEEGEPEWAMQARSFALADALLMSGEDLLADRKAIECIDRHGEFALTRPLSGQFWRWVARTGLKRDRAAGVLDGLRAACADLNRFDRIDQAEMLSSMILLEGDDERITEGRSRLLETISTLPEPTVLQLRRIGVCA